MFRIHSGVHRTGKERREQTRRRVARGDGPPAAALQRRPNPLEVGQKPPTTGAAQARKRRKRSAAAAKADPSCHVTNHHSSPLQQPRVTLSPYFWEHSCYSHRRCTDKRGIHMITVTAIIVK